MKNPIDSDIFTLAEKINDGIHSNNDVINIKPNLPHNIQSALSQINKITKNIREFSGNSKVLMDKGDQWAHLKIIKKIGQGGIGEVYCAHDPILDSNVAVKFLNRKSQLYISQEQFLQEARNMVNVRHPHVLAIHGATVDKGIAGFWGDYLDGQLLQDCLDKKSLEWERQLTYAMQLCQAVKAIHNNHLVHGDIKALNVMIQPDRGIILLDFGSSRQDRSKPYNNHIHQASPISMAPEQFADMKCTQLTDIYALGLLFWHLNTSSHPLINSEYNDIEQQIKSLPIKRSQLNGPRQWQRLILSMVAQNPAQRPDIYAVEKTLYTLSQKPIKRAKKLAMASALTLAVGISIISMYSNYKTQQANQETRALNQILTDVLVKSSPPGEVKGILTVDVLSDVEQMLLNNQVISTKQKHESLLQLVNTYYLQNKKDKLLKLSTVLLKDSKISDSMRLELLVKKSNTTSQINNIKQTEKLLLQAIKIQAKSQKDIQLQLTAYINLVHLNNKQELHTTTPLLIKKLKLLWEKGDRKPDILAQIHLLEGNHYEIRNNHMSAHKEYQLATDVLQKHYSAKNQKVLIAKGAAAAALTLNNTTFVQGTKSLDHVVQSMIQVLGRNHSTTLAARIYLANIFESKGLIMQATNQLINNIPDFHEHYGYNSKKTLYFDLRILNYHLMLNKHEIAKRWFDSMYKNAYLSMDNESATIIRNKIHPLQKAIHQEQFATAKDIIQSALSTQNNRSNVPFNWITLPNDFFNESDSPIFNPDTDFTKPKKINTVSLWSPLHNQTKGESNETTYGSHGQTLIHGDFNADGFDDLVIGIPGYDLKSDFDTQFNRQFSGAAEVIYGSKNGLKYDTSHLIFQQHNDGQTENFDAFATAMTTGDFNADGFTDLAVGVPYEDYNSGENTSPPKLINSGAINIFYGSNIGLSNKSVFIQEPILATNPEQRPQSYGHFGWSLTAADFNQDGAEDLIVSAPQKDIQTNEGNMINAGMIHVFYGSTNGITVKNSTSISQNTLGNNSAGAFDQFGWALNHGDFDHDGFIDLVIGLPFESTDPTLYNGMVQVIKGNKNGISQHVEVWSQARDIVGFEEDGDMFGYAVAVGDFNGDQIDDLLIGVPGEDYFASGVFNGGVAQIIYGSDHGLTESNNQLILQNAADNNDKAEDNDLLGTAVFATDFNADGFDDAVIGVPYEDIGNNINSGLIHIIFGSETGQVINTNNSNYYCKSMYSSCGISVTSGNFGHGNSLIIGAPGITTNQASPHSGGIIEISYNNKNN